MPREPHAAPWDDWAARMAATPRLPLIERLSARPCLPRRAAVGAPQERAAPAVNLVVGYVPGVQIRDLPRPDISNISSLRRFTNAAGSSSCPPSASVA